MFAALGFLGRILTAQGDYAGARTALLESLALAQEVGSRHDMAWEEAGLADAVLAAGDAAQAEVHYRSALQLAVDSTALLKGVYALAGLAVLRVQAGDPEGALELARQVSLHPASTGVAGARAAEILHKLDPDGANQPVAAAAGSFEEVVQGILAGPTRSD